MRGDVGELLRARRSSAPAPRRPSRSSVTSENETTTVYGGLAVGLDRARGDRQPARRAVRPAQAERHGDLRAPGRRGHRAAAARPRAAACRRRATNDHSGSLSLRGQQCAGSMPRIRSALGFAVTSRPLASTISTPSSSDSTSERNASRSRSDARHVARQHEAQRADERRVHERPQPRRVGAVVVDDRGRDPLLDQHVGDGGAERDPVLVERQRGHHHEEVEVRLALAVRRRGRAAPSTTAGRPSRPATARAGRRASAARRPRRRRRSRRSSAACPMPWSYSSETTGIAATCAHSSQRSDAVARLPLALRQRAAMRQHGTEVPGRVP